MRTDRASAALNGPAATRLRSVHHAALRRVTAPTLFLNPTDDPQYESMQRAHAHLPSAEYREMPGVGSAVPGYVAVMTRLPREYVEAAAAFLREG